jgi:hypothetical protein
MGYLLESIIEIVAEIIRPCGSTVLVCRLGYGEGWFEYYLHVDNPVNGSRSFVCGIHSQVELKHT